MITFILIKKLIVKAYIFFFIGHKVQALNFKTYTILYKLIYVRVTF